MAKGGIERILPKNQEIRDTALGNFPKVKEAFEQMSDREKAVFLKKVIDYRAELFQQLERLLTEDPDVSTNTTNTITAAVQGLAAGILVGLPIGVGIDIVPPFTEHWTKTLPMYFGVAGLALATLLQKVRDNKNIEKSELYRALGAFISNLDTYIGVLNDDSRHPPRDRLPHEIVETTPIPPGNKLPGFLKKKQ